MSARQLTAFKNIGNRERAETRIIKSQMETTDSLSLIFVIYVSRAEATCSFVIFPLSQETGGGFSRVFTSYLHFSYSNASKSMKTIYS